ncbi:MAG: glycosyl hydrolase [Gemmatimonadota bacterium]
MSAGRTGAATPAVRMAVLLAAGLGLAGAPALQAQGRNGNGEAAFDTTLYHAMKWRNIGPFRGGRATAVAGVPSETETYYFGGAGGGVWKTEDAGVTWRNVSDGFFHTASVGAIAVAGSDPNVVYAGMGESAVRGVTTSHGDGVYRSTDAGATWTHVGLEATRAISRIRVDPRDPDRVYVAAQGAPFGPSEQRGVYRSLDGGRTWERVLYVNPTTGASDLSLDPTNPRILYAALWDHQRKPWVIRSGGPGSGLYRSTDGGDTWKKLEKGLPELMGKTSVDVSPADPSRVWAIVEAEEGGLFRSDDGGATWKRLNSKRVLRARAWYYTEVFADPTDRETVYVLNAPILRSVDGGRTFVEVPDPHGDNHDLWINPNDDRVLIDANDGGANISFNRGETWSTQKNQPTAQIYRLSTDHVFPYRLYGGQQDNTSVAISAWVTHGGGIGWKDWFDAGGGEAATVAFDPEHPAYIYATDIQGVLTELDTRTMSVRSVRAYPEFGLGMDPANMKYRFNWNAPVLVSVHDPSVIYHGANLLLKSTDRGTTWTEISPDLTRNEKGKQGAGGVPITNEAAGGEVYNTIFTIAESPHDPGTLWVGTDDGRVQLTRDGGATWTDVTPPGLGEAVINQIEVSPHDPATAYIAAHRYKFDDFSPYLFQTTDYGKSWRRTVAGIGREAWVRVVREDPVRPGLLYAGTELGAYVSFDHGKRWQSLQLDLPVVPITDLRVQSGDLVAATQGRAFWILDDLSPLRQMSERIAASELHLFAPRPAYRVSGGQGGPVGPGKAVGRNAPAGAILDYVLTDASDTTLTIQILDEAGAVIRTFRSDTTEAEDGRRYARAPAEPGHNRLVWDLRREGPLPLPGATGPFARGGGSRVMPGRYTVRLSLGETVLTRRLEIRADPRLRPGTADFAANARFLRAVDADISELHDGVRRLRDVRNQLRSLLERVAEVPEGEPVREPGQALSDSLTALENGLVQTRRKTVQDIVNFPPRLDTQLHALRGEVDATDSPPTAGARLRLEDLGRAWTAQKAILDRLLGKRLERFNALVRDSGIPAILTGPRPKTVS